MNWADIQIRLKELGFDPGSPDGVPGTKTVSATMAALDRLGELLPSKPGATKPAGVVPPPPSLPASSFDALSQQRLKQAHPLLQKLMLNARERIPFRILDSLRGRAEQELAFRRGNSKAHFGQSAHNFKPAVALDIVPIPLDWEDTRSFRELQEVIGWYDAERKDGAGLALQMKIPCRWGGDWNMNGKADEKLVDMPHYELHPWRNYAEKLYEG